MTFAKENALIQIKEALFIAVMSYVFYTLPNVILAAVYIFQEKNIVISPYIYCLYLFVCGIFLYYTINKKSHKKSLSKHIGIYIWGATFVLSLIFRPFMIRASWGITEYFIPIFSSIGLNMPQNFLSLLFFYMTDFTFLFIPLGYISAYFFLQKSKTS